MPVDSQVVFTSESAPVSGTVRLYVDGTLGDDAAAGTSWATAWKTAAKVEIGIAEVLFPDPTALDLRCFVRGGFANEKMRLSHSLMGNTRVHLLHDTDDMTVVADGTVAAVGAAGAAHALASLTFNAPMVPDATWLGAYIIFDDGASRATFQVLRVSGGTVWTTATVGAGVAQIPAWVINGVAATVKRSSVTGLDLVSVSLRPAEGYLESYDSTHNVVFGLAAKSFAFDQCLWTLVSVEATSASLVMFTYGCVKTDFQLNRNGYGSTAYPDSLGQDLHIHSGVTPRAMVGCCAAGAGLQSHSRYSQVTGYYKDVSANSNASVYLAYAAIASAEALDGVVNTYATIITGTGKTFGIQSNHGGEIILNTSSFLDIPATGLTTGLVSVLKGGWCQIKAAVDGINTGTTGSGLVAVKASIGGKVHFDGAVNAGLDGKHGLLDARDAHVTFSTNSTRSVAAPGGGPDLYVEGGEIYFAANWVRSVVNTIPSPMLQVGRGAKVTQAAGKAFTVATPAADWVASYGAKGAIVADDGPVNIRLGTLTGGAAGVTTGIGCTIKNGSKLVHAGAGLLGVAPLDLGGVAAPQAWPAAATTDLAAATPQMCMVIPNVA